VSSAKSKRKRRGVSTKLPIIARGLAGMGRWRKRPTGPGAAGCPQSRQHGVPHVCPEGLIEGIEPLCRVWIFKRKDFLENERMTADGALTELDKRPGGC
jgi:hypothetical protein